MSSFRDLEISITHFLMVLQLIYCLQNGPDCRVEHDPVFNGSLVNCTNQKLTQSDLKNLPSHRVTTLDISYNNINFLPNNAFRGFKDLKRLICTMCNLYGMGNFSLKGPDNLEVLYLDRNLFDMTYQGQDNGQPAIPPSVFRYVPKVKELYIDNNGKYRGDKGDYSKYLDIFEYLIELTHLSLDSFETLKIGKEFLKFSKLYSLRVHCRNMKYIHDNSLEGFQNSTVKRFELTDGNIQQAFYRIELNVFQHLPNISYFGLRFIRVGNQNALLMLKPLAGKKIDTIIFDSVYSPGFGRFEDKVSDTIITVNDSLYLRNILVSNFLWFDSNIYSIEYDVVLSNTWQHSIKTAVLETAALTQTSIMLLYRLMLLKELEVIAYLNTGNGMRHRFHDFYSTDTNLMKNDFGYIQKQSDQITNVIKGEEINTRGIIPFHNVNTPVSTIQSINTSDQDMFEWVQENFSEANGLLASNNILEFVQGIIEIRVAPKLKIIILDGAHYVHLNHYYTLLRNQIDSIALTNGIGVLQFHGTVYGLENMTSFSLEGSQRVEIGLSFFDEFSSMKNLNLRKTCLKPAFYETNSRRIIEKLTALENMDQSDNGLKTLPTDMFLTNKQLKYLYLESNRFSKIPFSLKLTPALELLDLRGNSFVDLSAEDRAAIDNHILSVKNFTILLGNNELSCACSNLPFIAWLKTRQHHFDQNGNYACISEDGTMSFTGSHMDIVAFWRKCYANYYLMLSGILACGLVAVYLGLFLGMKKKTEIISKVLQIVVPGFKLKTRKDYLFDVCIGYADQDGIYIKDVLLRLLEDKWNLNTFVHQRDLRQDPLEMSNALRDSWRNLLVVTEAFLYRYDMAHNVMKVASFFVSPSNPRSVVVIVEESVRHRIPDYVLQVVDEDNIIILPRLEPVLDYETNEFLRTRLT